MVEERGKAGKQHSLSRLLSGFLLTMHSAKIEESTPTKISQNRGPIIHGLGET